LVCFRHATFFCVLINTFFCVILIDTISPSNSPPILTCTTTCHICVFSTHHIFLCPHWHIFLCPCHCCRLQVTRFRFLATSHRHIGAIARGSCNEFYRKMDSMRARSEKKIKSHGSSCKVLDSTLMSNDSSISVVRSIFKWIIIDVFQCNWTYLLTFPICVFMFSLLLVKRQYCRQNC
jgi:hypothetical protein